MTDNLALALLVAERWRPELALLDLAVAGPHAYEACRALSGSKVATGGSCRVVAGMPDATEPRALPALMAGASAVAAAPFEEAVVAEELERASERLSSR